MAAPRNRKQLIGTRYFRQVVITWSIRRRGNVQRSHICTKTRTLAFVDKTTRPNTFAR